MIRSAVPAGGFALEIGEAARKLTLPTRKDRLLLAYLALSAGQPQARDRLAGLLWGDRAETQARDSLKQALAGIRQAFRQVGLDPVHSGPRVRDVRAGRHRGRRRRVCAASDGVRRTCRRRRDMYRGDLLDGIDGVTAEFEEWLHPERERLGDLAVRVLEQLRSRAASE